MTREKVIESIEELYKKLDYNVTKLVKARLDKDTKAEGDALFSMEGLIVACQQELSFLHDYLKNNPEPQGLDEAAEEASINYLPKERGEAIDSNGDVYETDDVNWPDRVGFRNGFKAGAKWISPAYNTIKKVLALGFMKFLDEARPDDKMCLSNGECMDIEKAFSEQDWDKLERYLKKYVRQS